MIHPGPQKSLVGVVGGTYDGLAPDIERGIDQHRATGDLIEIGDQLPESGIGFSIHRLNPG